MGMNGYETRRKRTGSNGVTEPQQGSGEDETTAGWGAQEGFPQEVALVVHLKGRVETHWADLKGDHPERKEQ